MTLSDHAALGVGWMRIGYGRALLRDDDQDEQQVARVSSQPRDRTRLTMRDGSLLTVVRTQEGQTRTAWRTTVQDAIFDVELVLPFPPVPAVRALAETTSLPLWRR